MDACAARVAANPSHGETCTQELFDFLHCVDHCVPLHCFLASFIFSFRRAFLTLFGLTLVFIDGGLTFFLHLFFYFIRRPRRSLLSSSKIVMWLRVSKDIEFFAHNGTMPLPIGAGNYGHVQRKQ